MPHAMKFILVLVIFALSVSAAPLEDDDNSGRINGENGWYVPRPDVSYYWVTYEEGEKLLAEYEEIEIRDKPANPVTFYLYTKSNPTEAQTITPDYKSISQSNFNAENPTRFIVHGWTQNYTVTSMNIVRDAWLSKGEYNVIAVNWPRSLDEAVASSIAATPEIGKKIANFIDYLVQQHGMSWDDTHVIGHSMGAHVVGYAAKNVRTGKLHTIIGLDPALPLSRYNRTDKRLNSNDALYVESIQTSTLGFVKPIGKVTFYPNGVKQQPGCESDLTAECSHERSCEYYAEAIRFNNFGSKHCDSYLDVVNQTCDSQFSGVKMGDVENYKLASGGEYYVPVHNTSPYGYDE